MKYMSITLTLSNTVSFALFTKGEIMKAFYLHWNGLVYAMTIYGYSKKDALNRFKTENYIKRMPNGFAIWGA